jgi:hypothetical protein
MFFSFLQISTVDVATQRDIREFIDTNAVQTHAPGPHMSMSDAEIDVEMSGVDVDRLCVPEFPVRFIDRYLREEVDLATTSPYQHSELDLGLCVVFTPTGIYIPDQYRAPFFDALCWECPNKYLTLSHERNKFLQSATPRKINLQHVLNALTAANLQIVALFVYGQKSSVSLYSFLYLLPPHTHISMDLGFTIHQSTDHDAVPLATYLGPPRFQQGTITHYPMFTHISRTVIDRHPDGGLLWTNPCHECLLAEL